MKRLFRFGKKKAERQSPSRPASTTSASLSGSFGQSSSYEVRSKDLGKLHHAAATGDLEKLQQQLAKKHDLNERDKANRTPLHHACANGCTDIVTFLIDNGCRLNLCDNDNMSPLMKAVQCQQDFCATYLLEHGADVNLVDVNGNTALHYAAFKSNISVAQQLLEHNAEIDAKNKDGDTPLLVAVAESNQTMVEFLLKNGADIHARNDDGSLEEKIAEYAYLSNVEKSSKSKNDLPVFDKPNKAGDAGFMLGAPATNKEEMQQSLSQIAESSGKVVDEHSSGDLVSESGKTESDSWLSSEEEELDFSPKKIQKPSLFQLMNVSQQFMKNNNKSENDQSSKEKCKAGSQKMDPNTQESKDPNDSLTSDEEEESEEDEEDEEEDDEDEEEEEEEEEQEEGEEEMEDYFSQEREDEKRGGGGGGGGGESQAKIENEKEYFKKSEKRDKLPETFADNEHEGEGNHVNANTSRSSNEICNVQEAEIQETCNMPVSFIAERYECSYENTAINNLNDQLPSHSFEKENSHVYEEVNEFHNQNECKDTEGNKTAQESPKSSSKRIVCLSESFEVTAKAAFLSPLKSNSKNRKNSNPSDTFESDDDLGSEEELVNDKAKGQNANNPVFVDDRNIKEIQYMDPERLEKVIYEPQKSEISKEENLKENAQPNIKGNDKAERDGTEEAENVLGVLDKSVTCNNSAQNQKLLLSGMIQEGKFDDSQPDTAKGNVEEHNVTSSHILKGTETREKQKSDLMEELGLDNADDIEDTSNWDSPSVSQKSVPCADSSNVLMLEEHSSLQQLVKNDAAAKTSEIIPVGEELSGAQTVITAKDQQCNEQGIKEIESDENEVWQRNEQDIKEAESDENEDEGVVDTPNSIEKPSRESHIAKAKVLFTCEKKKTDAVILTEKSNRNHSQFDSTLWEERYKKLWVANEKKEVKTNFKSITTELKQMFGEINVKEKVSNIPVEGGLQGFSGALEGINESQSCHLSAATADTQGKGDFGHVRSVAAEKRFSTEKLIVCSPDSVSEKHLLKLCEHRKENVDQNCKANDKILPNSTEGTRVNVKAERHDNIFVQLETSMGGKSTASEKCPDYLPMCRFKNIVSDTPFKTTSIKQLKTVDDRNILSDVAKSTIRESLDHFTNGVFRDYTISSCKDNETETGNKVESSDQSCHQTSKKELDEELESDVARFKNEVGMLQIVFLALERERAQLQKEVEEEKRKQKQQELEAAGKNEDANFEKKLSGNTAEQKMQKLNGNENQHMETAPSLEEESQVNVVPSAEGNELIPLPFKGKNATISVKDVRKSENKQQISKQRANQQNSEKLRQLQDYRSSGDASLEEDRHPYQTVNEKKKIYRAISILNDSDDLPQSSDTATEDIELPNSVYSEGMELIEQLSLGSKDSVSILKIQNVFHGYERLITHERGRSARLLGKVKKLETEKREQQRMVEEMREEKSMLDRQKVEWEDDLSSLKFSLKQEKEKRTSAEMLYEKNREHLRKKEEQHSKEMEEKQQLELMLRNLEMELRTLKNHLKEVEEERNEKQQQLSHEQNARALQEGILNTHIWRQSELQEEWKRTLSKSSEMADHREQEKELLHKNQILQNELSILRLELDHIRAQHQEEETKYIDENETLKQKIEELKKELKFNEEALTETVLQYKGQINASKTECAMLSSRLEHIQEIKERLEVEHDSLRCCLSSALQEVEQCQISKTDLEQIRQRERDGWLCVLNKLQRDLCNLQETNNSMSQQLSKAEGKANHLESELHHITHTLREKTLMSESTERELSQARCYAKELENALQLEKDQLNKYVVKQDSIQERFAQLQSENHLLQQQMEDYHNKGVTKEKVVADIQDRFNDIYSNLKADTERQVQMMEDRNKELIKTCSNLREQIFKYETEKVEREGAVRQLQQELADSLKKHSISEASLQATARCSMDLEEEKQKLQKEIDRLKSKLEESEEQYIQSERNTHDLRNALDAKEHEASVAAQKLQDLLVTSSGTNNGIKQLEEHTQRLEIENARLEVKTKQQAGRIEILQKNLQDSASVHGHLEEMITSLQTAKVNLEEQLNDQVQKQNMLSVTAQDTHHMWEEEFKSKSKLGIRLSELDREKVELTAQFENERKKVKKLVEFKRSAEMRLDQEMKRNDTLQKECNKMKKLLKDAKKKVKEYENRESLSQTSSQCEIKHRHSEIDTEIAKLKIKVDELSHQLETESKTYTQLESMNRDLQDQLSSMKIRKLQLEEEVAKLKCLAQGNLRDQHQIEQHKRDIEEKARQEIRQKLEEVNLFLQTQAASQENLEQIRVANNSSLRSQLEQKIQEQESELARLKSNQQDNISQKEFTQRELERYKCLYLEEQKRRKSLGSKLDRANDRLAEINAKLLHERHRSKPSLASCFVSRSPSGSPILETVHFGNLGSNIALSRTFNLGGGFINSTGNPLSSKNRVEAYLAKMRVELEKNITKEVDKAAGDLDAGSVRVSPVGSIDRSSNILEQDPVSKAWQEYRAILKKNYMI